MKASDIELLLSLFFLFLAPVLVVWVAFVWRDWTR